jgi:hypothetical protein
MSAILNEWQWASHQAAALYFQKPYEKGSSDISMGQ